MCFPMQERTSDHVTDMAKRRLDPGFDPDTVGTPHGCITAWLQWFSIMKARSLRIGRRGRLDHC